MPGFFWSWSERPEQGPLTDTSDGRCATLMGPVRPVIVTDGPDWTNESGCSRPRACACEPGRAADPIPAWTSAAEASPPAATSPLRDAPAGAGRERGATAHARAAGFLSTFDFLH